MFRSTGFYMMENSTPQDEDLFGKIKFFLLDNYGPVNAMDEEVLSFTTDELFLKLQGIFPTPVYTAHDVALWLDDCGFVFIDKGNLKLEWLLKKIPRGQTPQISILKDRRGSE